MNHGTNQNVLEIDDRRRAIQKLSSKVAIIIYFFQKLENENKNKRTIKSKKYRYFETSFFESNSSLLETFYRCSFHVSSTLLHFSNFEHCITHTDIDSVIKLGVLSAVRI